MRAVDDVGRAVNPMIVHGQIHGGIAQGIGQALLEQCCLRSADRRSCCPARSWITRCRAPTMLPFFVTELSEVPTPTHPLGMRPAGEGGTTPALGAVVNAIVDALAEFGVSISRCRRRRNASGARSTACSDTADNITGNAVCEGGLMIDLSPMKGIRVDPVKARRDAPRPA